jgi:Subtilase family
MANRQFPHIVLRNIARRERFARPGTGGTKYVPSAVPDRELHAQMLFQRLRASQDEARENVARRANVLPQSQNGIYLTIEGRPQEPLLTERLERRKKNIELLAVKEERDRTTATVFVPESARDFLARTIEDYRTKNEPLAIIPEPKGRRLLEGIGDIRLAALRDLWIDDPKEFPGPGDMIDWEVWLRPVATDRFRVAAMEAGIVCGSQPLVFPEDVALFVVSSAESLAHLNESTLGISRLARSKKMTDFSLPVPEEQARQMEELLARVQTPDTTQTSLCILDTGVKREHRLLVPVLAPEDCHAYRDEWGPEDHHGHGTQMAGVCCYGDLARVMGNTQQVTIPYRIESVKIFPPIGTNPHELLGAITAGGVARAELAQPGRKRLFCLATSTDEDSPHRGRPTSWSAELDQLCFGSEITPRVGRLFCVAVGNIREPAQLRHADYPVLNDLSEIESPGHAWNVLTIGGITELTEINDTTRAGWLSFAKRGDLCPVSRTANWSETWPIKPDVVMEAGNLGVDPADGLGYGFPEVRLLTTSREYPQVPFEDFGDTSAAAASAARLCAIVQSQYPNLWAESIRALVVDSAAWTPTMLSHLPANPKKADHGLLLKRYGFGVPDLGRALYSASDALTLIAEDTIQPYAKQGNKKAVLNEMKLFSLPWPREQLIGLGGTAVELRVTLSYFIEPNPAESARNQKSRYCSHGLRFAVMLPDEDVNEFRKRVNKVARQEGDHRHAQDTGWILGSDLRDRGSLHSDLWRGRASDLALRGAVAVFPVAGWWKEREYLERYHRITRFALVVSIRTPPTEVDIYTPVTNQIAIQL